MADGKRRRIHECACQECRERTDDEMLEYHQAINRVMVELDERSRRLFAGLLAKQMGHGGIQRLCEITGLSRVTIRRGSAECNESTESGDGRIRRVGGGRKRIEKKLPK